MARHGNHSLEIQTTDMVSATIVGTITNLSHSLNSTVIAPDTGNVYDLSQIITSQQPTMPFGSLAIASLLDVVGLVGRKITSDGTHIGVRAFAQSYDSSQAKARGAAGSHLSMVAGQGHVVLDQITANKSELASVTGHVIGQTSDGNSYPFTIAYNATLPASPTVDEQFGLGKAQVLGVTVDRITSLTMSFTPQADMSNDADSIWPSLIDIGKVSVLTTIVTEDPKWLNSSGFISEVGSQATHANTEIYLLKRAVNAAPVSGGAFESFAGSTHIKGTLAGLVHVTDHYSASGSGLNSTQIQIASIENSSGTAPVVWDTTSTYGL